MTDQAPARPEREAHRHDPNECSHCRTLITLGQETEKALAEEAPAQPSADVVGALEKATEQLLIEHGHNEDSDADWPACRIVHPVLSEAHRALAAAREAGPPAAGRPEDEALHEILKATADRYEGTNWRAVAKPILQPTNDDPYIAYPTRPDMQEAYEHGYRAGSDVPAAEGWSAGGDFGVGIPGSKGYVPPHVAATVPRHTCRHGIEPCEACAAAEPADEGLRLLRELTDAVDGAPGDGYWTDKRGSGNKPWNEARAYLAAHPEPEGRR